MIRVYVAADRVLVGFLKGVLEDQGIACLVRNEYLGGGIGELPPQECWPELHVLEQRDVETARQLIAAALSHAPATAARWQCPACGEWLEPQFESCWRCAPPEKR